jgi:hypothetical protein
MLGSVALAPDAASALMGGTATTASDKPDEVLFGGELVAFGRLPA